MSTSHALTTTKKSSWKDPALTAASLALKIAKEATDDVPIVKQIVGVALSIVELAEKAEKNRDALRMLAEKAATLAQLVKQVVDGRTVDGQLAPLLERLTLVLGKVEAFMLKETAKGNTLKKMYRSVFVLQSKVDELSNELETEIRGFTIATLVDTRVYMAETRVYMEENSQHEGQFRRLRDYEVRKLAVILERETEHGTVVFAQARVQGESELMVVKYLKGAVQAGQTSDVWTASTENIMTRVSTLELSHPNVTQFYGRGVDNGRTRFIVLRTGAHYAGDYLSQVRLNDTERFQECFRMQLHVLAASAHLERMGIAWFPQSLQPILVDDHGQPYIGTFDDLVSSEICERRDQARGVLWLMEELRRLSSPIQVQCKEAASPDSCDSGLLKMCIECILSHSPMLPEIWARLCAEELYMEITTERQPIADRSQIPPATVTEAGRHHDDLYSCRYPPIQQQPSSVLTVPQHGELEEGFMELNVSCRSLYDQRTLMGYHILYGLQVTIHHYTERGYTFRSYTIDLRQGVAAEVCTILYGVEDPIEALNLFTPREFFRGIVRVPPGSM